MKGGMVQDVVCFDEVPRDCLVTVAAMARVGFDVQLRRHRPDADYNDVTVWGREPGKAWQHMYPLCNLGHAMQLLDAAGGFLQVGTLTIDVETCHSKTLTMRGGSITNDICLAITQHFYQEACAASKKMAIAGKPHDGV